MKGLLGACSEVQSLHNSKLLLDTCASTLSPPPRFSKAFTLDRSDRHYGRKKQQDAQQAAQQHTGTHP